jgi:hypothetical protein
MEGQEDTTKTHNINQEEKIVKKHFNNFNEMHISHYGTTQQCEPYEVYAFKFRRFWFLFVKQNEKLTLMHIKPPIKDKEIHYPSTELAKNIARCYSLKYTKLVKKKRKVIDMDIYGFYKFNRFGRKVIKGLLLLEYPFYNKGFFKWKLDKEEIKKGVTEKSGEEAKKKINTKKIEAIKAKVKNAKEKAPVKNK